MTKTRKFTKGELTDSDYEFINEPEIEIVYDQECGSGRWDIFHEIVWQMPGEKTYWRYTYSVGATEYQDYGAWESSDTVTAVEVKPVVKTVIAFEEA